MHPLLLNADIMETICIHLRGRDLLSLALTCKDIKEPALDALWHTIHNLTPILKLLPDDLLTVAHEDYFLPELTLKRTPVPTDWERVLKYAYRVRVVEDLKYGCDPPSSEASLVASLPYSRLLPNARNLTIEFALETTFDLFRAMLSPHVKILTVTFRSYSDDPVPLPPPGLNLLSYVQDTCRDIEVLQFPLASDSHFPRYSSFFATVVAMDGSFSGMHTLKKLTAEVSRREDVHAIASLPSLVELGIYLRTDSFDIPELWTNPHKSQHGIEHAQVVLFPALRQLNISTEAPTSCAQFLSAFSSNPNVTTSKITTLSLRLFPYDYGYRANYWDSISSVIVDIPSLTTLHLSDDAIEREVGPNFFREFRKGKMLHPFYALTGIRDFQFISEFAISLRTETLHLMASSWPFLESVHINGTFTRPPRIHYPSILALRSFADHCPNLSSFTCQIDPNADFSKCDKGHVLTHTTPIRLRFLGSKEIQDPAGVGEFIARTFKRPTVVSGKEYSSGPDSDYTFRDWSKVSLSCKRAIEQQG